MSFLVVAGAMCSCSFGTTPSGLMIPPENKVLGCNKPAATIMDYQPNKNILPFGMCTTTTNPQVASATSAALGVLTPMPCMPVIVAPWAPGCAKVMIAGKPSLGDNCSCQCNWGGQIKVSDPGERKIQLP